MKRYIVVKYSPDKIDKYKQFKKEYKKHQSDLKKRNVIVKKIINKSREQHFEINLIGYDKKIKYRTNKINKIPKMIKMIDNMPIGKIEKLKNVDLYTDAHTKTTIKNLGFKNKEKAIYTINKTNKLKLKDQFRIINVMYNRAKYHPNKTKDIKEAMKVFKKWLKKN